MGAISVQSTPEKGSVFEVYLPAATLTTTQVVQKEHQIKGGSEHILVVDDEAALVTMMTDILSRQGYTVEGATSSLEALELFRSAPDRFDIVITDLTMPHLCGDQLARQINELRPVPIILHTGFSDGMAEKSIPEFGITAIMEKPILPWQLTEKVRQLLDDKGT